MRAKDRGERMRRKSQWDIGGDCGAGGEVERMKGMEKRGFGW